MSWVTSKIPSLDALRFEPFTAQAVELVKVRAVDGCVVGVDKSGTIYTNKVSSRRVYDGREAGMRQVLDGCIKLGVLSAEAVKEHMAIEDEAALARQRRHAAASILRQASEAGLKLTERQRTYLGKVSTSEDD